MILPKLNEEEKKQFAQGIVKVNGSAMNRTALGIIAAFFQLYPKVTFSELKEAFPDSLNPSGPNAPKSIFKPFTNRDFGVVHSLEEIKKQFAEAGLPYEGLFFLEKEEMFTTADGVVVIVNKLWQSNDIETGQSDLQVLANRAIKFGITVEKFEFTKAFVKGSYSIEIIQPELYKKITEVKQHSFPSWLWIIIALIILLFALWFAGVFNSSEEQSPAKKDTTVLQFKNNEIFNI